MKSLRVFILTFILLFSFFLSGCNDTPTQNKNPKTNETAFSVTDISTSKETQQTLKKETENEEKQEPETEKQEETTLTESEEPTTTAKQPTIIPENPKEPENRNTAKVLSANIGAPNTLYTANNNLRSVVVEYMYKMANIVWTAPETIDNSRMSPSLIYKKGQTYYGMIYNWDSVKQFSTFTDALKNKTSLQQIGNTCSTSILEAWQRVSTKCKYSYTIDMTPNGGSNGLVAIGNIPWEKYDGNSTIKTVLGITPDKDLFEAYALTKPGDAFMRHPNHAMMVTGNTVVVRNNGNIDPSQSYVVLTHQNSPMDYSRQYPSSWKVDFTMTFKKLKSEGYLPVTITELRDGIFEKPCFYLSNEIDLDSFLKNGTINTSVKSNYKINILHLEIRKNTENGTPISYQTVEVNSKSYNIESRTKNLNIQSLSAGKYYLVVSATNDYISSDVLKIEFTK